MSNNSEIRYCKECGCELMSTNKNELCENCRRKRNKKFSDGLLPTVAFVASVAIAIIRKIK